MSEPITQNLTDAPTETQSRNEVTLVGRMSAAPEHRDLPSGDALVTLRLVVARPPPPRKRGQRLPPKRTVEAGRLVRVSRSAG
ncbi:MAG: hypothetical protein JWR90_1177 [Marmoricola sp.]|nr:hypothetical protein [Marmoricola sp.]